MKSVLFSLLLILSPFIWVHGSSKSNEKKLMDYSIKTEENEIGNDITDLLGNLNLLNMGSYHVQDDDGDDDDDSIPVDPQVKEETLRSNGVNKDFFEKSDVEIKKLGDGEIMMTFSHPVDNINYDAFEEASKRGGNGNINFQISLKKLESSDQWVLSLLDVDNTGSLQKKGDKYVSGIHLDQVVWSLVDIANETILKNEGFSKEQITEIAMVSITNPRANKKLSEILQSYEKYLLVEEQDTKTLDIIPDDNGLYDAAKRLFYSIDKEPVVMTTDGEEFANSSLMTKSRLRLEVTNMEAELKNLDENDLNRIKELKVGIENLRNKVSEENDKESKSKEYSVMEKLDPESDQKQAEDYFKYQTFEFPRSKEEKKHHGHAKESFGGGASRAPLLFIDY